MAFLSGLFGDSFSKTQLKTDLSSCAIRVGKHEAKQKTEISHLQKACAELLSSKDWDKAHMKASDLIVHQRTLEAEGVSAVQLSQRERESSSLCPPSACVWPVWAQRPLICVWPVWAQCPLTQFSHSSPPPPPSPRLSRSSSPSCVTC